MRNSLQGESSRTTHPHLVRLRKRKESFRVLQNEGGEGHHFQMNVNGEEGGTPRLDVVPRRLRGGPPAQMQNILDGYSHVEIVGCTPVSQRMRNKANVAKAQVTAGQFEFLAETGR